MKKAKSKGHSPKSKPRLILGRPADKSLQAYKRWIIEMTRALGGKETGMSEEEWRRDWKQFWTD